MDTTLHDPLVGQALDGRYLIQARVAAGGMATVYRAVDTRLDRVLAVKVMHPSLAGDPDYVERFIREAKAVARLDHPNVVSVWDQGSDGTYVYLAMEYVPGCTLRDVLRERGALRPRAALDILQAVLAGLGAAHGAGLVHRDMKPENVLIADDGRVKVVDFGLVRSADTNTTTSDGVLGSVSYMAPEQIERGSTDPRWDVYSCGVLLYEMLTGQKPRSDGTPAQIIYRHLHEDVPPPSAAVPGLAGALDGLVAQAAAREAAVRPADAGQLLARVLEVRQSLTDGELDALPPGARPAAVDDGEPTTVLPRSQPAPRSEPTARFEVPPEAADVPARPRPPRRPGLVALIGALVLAVCLGAGFWYLGDATRTPGLINLPLADARGRLAAAGLNSEVTYAYSETIAKGRVISSDPARGAEIRDGGTVTLTVSKGPQRITVPDLSGKSLAAARAALKSGGLTPGPVKRAFSDTADAGAVVSTSPAAGVVTVPGAVVTLTVSRGTPIDVPNVIGQSVADAQQRLQAAGLKVTLSDRRIFSDAAAAGEVAAVSPAVGAQVAHGDTVTLTLSKGQRMTTVPDVDGKSVDDAKRILQAAGFKVKVIQLFFIGTVTSQSPDAGEQAPEGSTVTVWAD